jgi:hypothetical protein
MVLIASVAVSPTPRAIGWSLKLSNISAPEMPRIAFIDLEASGLGSNSFPTEIGWAVICEDGPVVSDSCLIRPPAKWTLYANAWSTASEHLTGITRAMLDKRGLPPSEALKRFLDAVALKRTHEDWRGLLHGPLSQCDPRREHLYRKPDQNYHMRWLGMAHRGRGGRLRLGASFLEPCHGLAPQAHRRSAILDRVIRPAIRISMMGAVEAERRG